MPISKPDMPAPMIQTSNSDARDKPGSLVAPIVRDRGCPCPPPRGGPEPPPDPASFAYTARRSWNGSSNSPDPSVLAAPLYIAALLFELACIQLGRARGHYTAKDTATSLTMGAGSVVWGALFALGVQGLLFFAYQFRIATLPITGLTFVLCFVLDDFRYYWSHRFGHESRWFWASHVTHHSSTHYNLSTALRQPWTLSGLFVLKVPLVLLGFHSGPGRLRLRAEPRVPVLDPHEAIRRMPGWFEAIFNTPSHHRVHHGTNPRYLDANYAGVFIVWDKLFGSFVPEEDDEPVRYGLVTRCAATTRCAWRTTSGPRWVATCCDPVSPCESVWGTPSGAPAGATTAVDAPAST